MKLPAARLPNTEFRSPVVLAKPAWVPKKELSDPVLLSPALLPKKELVAPVVLSAPAEVPKKALALPVVFERPAKYPKKALSFPIVLALPAKPPKAELRMPIVLAAPAAYPKKEFSAPVLLVPALLKTRLPPMLYCVLVLMLPATSNSEFGLFVPMPTLPDGLITMRNRSFPVLNFTEPSSPTGLDTLPAAIVNRPR